MAQPISNFITRFDGGARPNLFEVEWVDNFGNSYPLLLAPGASATMKILFRKKDFQTAKISYD